LKLTRITTISVDGTNATIFMVSLIFVKVLMLACGVWMVSTGLSSWSL